jgi:hypothetical protein
MPVVGHNPDSIRFTLDQCTLAVLEDEITTSVEALGCSMREELQHRGGAPLEAVRVEHGSTLLFEYRELLLTIAQIERPRSGESYEIHLPTPLAEVLVTACTREAMDRLRDAIEKQSPAEELRRHAIVASAWVEALADMRFLWDMGLEDRDMD